MTTGRGGEGLCLPSDEKVVTPLVGSVADGIVHRTVCENDRSSTSRCSLCGGQALILAIRPTFHRLILSDAAMARISPIDQTASPIERWTYVKRENLDMTLLRTAGHLISVEMKGRRPRHTAHPHPMFIELRFFHPVVVLFSTYRKKMCGERAERRPSRCE